MLMQGDIYEMAAAAEVAKTSADAELGRKKYHPALHAVLSRMEAGKTEKEQQEIQRRGESVSWIPSI